MKKTTIILGLVLFAQFGMSQSKFRFGLKVAPSINWLKPSAKKISSNGSSLGFGGGLTIEYALADNFSFYSGLELQTEKGKIDFMPNGTSSTSVFYFMNNDYSFSETSADGSGNYAGDTTANKIQLKNRSYKNSYVTIPVGIKMKTKEIGYMTYFGEFGLNLAFRTGTKVDDEVDYSSAANPADAQINLSDISEVPMDKDMQPLRVQLKFGLGAEYKISEGTSVFAGLHYNLGFTNVVKGESRYLISNNIVTNKDEPVSQNFKAHGIQLTIGVLF